MLFQSSVIFAFSLLLTLMPAAFTPTPAHAAISFGFDGTPSIFQCDTASMTLQLHYFATLEPGELYNWRGGYNGVQLWVNPAHSADFDANFWFNDYSTLTYPYTAYGEQALEVNGVEVEIWRWDATCTSLDTGTVTYRRIDLTNPAQPAPQTGMISISARQGQPVYESASGSVVKDAGGNELWLPQDYDNNGFDTFLVMDSVTVDGRTWVQIFLGAGDSMVWIPLDQVTVIE